MPGAPQQGHFTYSVRVSRPDGEVLGETPFRDLQAALGHFHGMVRNAPQPGVYVQLCQYDPSKGGTPETLETGFCFGPPGTCGGHDE